MCCVRSRQQIGGTGAQLASTVAGDVPSCQPRERSRFKISPGHFVSRHSRDSAKPYRRVPADGTERNDGRIWGEQGNPRQQAAESSDGVSDQFGFPQ